MPETPRWLAHIVAFLRGFYWMPCPLCGRMYGAQEATTEDIGVVDGKAIRPSQLPFDERGCSTWKMVCNRHHPEEANGGI